MRDTELYRHLLGLEQPWSVSRVELEIKNQQVDVWAEHATGERWSCPRCEARLPVYDHSDERSWRHLDSCQFKTYLHARPPRVKCPEHGVLQVRLPWAEPHSRFTALFERLAIDVLLETDVQGATRILRITWDEAWRLMERAVARGQRRKEERVVRHVGVDEKAIAKRHKYMTLVSDLSRSCVEYVTEDRKKESLDGYFRGLNAGQLAGIEAIAIDMWEPYVQSILEHLPEARDKIVFDRYHIMKHMGRAVDDVRKREHRECLARGDEILKRTKYMWLYSEENLPEQYWDRFDALQAAHLKTARAWAIKESLRDLWGYARRGWALRHWRHWYFWATHSRLGPVIKVAGTLKRHLHNVLTYIEHRITNAVSEGLNSKIGTIQKMAYGFRNREHFKTAIYFHCGGLDLYPATHGNPG